MIYNINIGSQLLGCIFKNPSLIMNPQFPLQPDDFAPEQFHKILFLCASKAYQAGINDITEIEIDNIAKSHNAAYEILVDNRFEDFVATVRELASLDNYESYWNSIRKYSMLRQMKEAGMNVDKWFDETIDNGDRTAEFTIQEILAEYEILTNKLRTTYDTKYVRHEMYAGEDTEGLLEQFEQKPMMGACLSSSYETTIYNGWCRSQLLLRGAKSGLGKALTNDTILPTPNGFKRVDKIKVGDLLWDRHGNPTKVTGVFPQGAKEVYEVRFKDGRAVKCCDEHLWTVRDSCAKPIYDERTYTLREIIDKHWYRTNDKGHKIYRFQVPLCDPIKESKKTFYIPPYCFGLMLGNGSFRSHSSNHAFSFSSDDEWTVKYIADSMGWTYKKNSRFNFNWSFYNQGKLVHVEDVLVDYPDLINTYSRTKYIPDDYLCGSEEQRFELLRGLMDTDGCVGQKNRLRYDTVSQRLRDDVKRLCYSLGLIVRDGTDYREDKNDCYYLTIRCNPDIKAKLFKLPRKLNKVLEENSKNKRREHNHGNTIIDIVDLGYKSEMTCFMVDNEEHLFLANDYVVTHNTRMAVTDLCTIGAKQLWDDEAQDFIDNPNYQGSTFFIHTEMETRINVNPMFLACISGVDNSTITKASYTKDERNRILKAGEILKDSCIRLVDMPNFTSRGLETKIKECVQADGATYGVFDYIWLNRDVSLEYQQSMGTNVRPDMAIASIAADLKQYAEAYNVGLMTMCQLSRNYEQQEFCDASCLAGAVAMQDKLDCGSVMIGAKDKPKSWKKVEAYIKKRGFGEGSEDDQPNIVEHIFKARYQDTSYSKFKIWSKIDRGTMRRKDYFVTDENDELISINRTTPYGEKDINE